MHRRFAIDGRILAGVLIVLLAASFFRGKNLRLWRGPGPEPEILSVDDADPEMNAAIQKARKTVGDFIDALSHPRLSRTNLSIKLAIRDQDEVEHFWLNNVQYSDGTFSGDIANTPNSVQSVTFGQPLSVPAAQISDWMYIENGALKGGFTMRVMRNRLTPKERADFDANIGFRIE